MNGPVDPFRKRDLPNPEAMLARILSDVDAERTDEPDEQRGEHRWLRFAAAAAAVAVIAGVGWTVTQPAMQQVVPGGQPVPGLPTPTPTPTPERTVVPQPLPSIRINPPTRPPTPTATPTPTPTPTPSVTPTPTPSATPTPTPTPSASPTPTPSATAPSVEPPRVAVAGTRRIGTSRPGFDVAVVDAVACPGSRGAQLRGPWVEGATVLSGEGMLSPGGTLVDRNACIQLRVEVEVPTAAPTAVTLWVDMQYAAGSAEEVNNGPHEASVTIN